MKGFSVVLPLLASSLVAANPIEQQPQQAVTAQSIQQDVHGIDTGVYNLRKDLRNYQGGALSETPLGIDLIGIHDANRKGYANANGRTEPFSQAESAAIIQYFQSTIGKDMAACINDLKAKKPLFQSSGQDALIAASLKSLLYDHDTYSASVSKLLTGNQQDAYNMALSIHNAIQNGIDFFDSADAGVAKEGLRLKRDAAPGWGESHGSSGNSEGWRGGHGEPAGGYHQTPTPSQANWKSAPTPSQANWGPHGNSGSWGGNRGNANAETHAWGSEREGRHIGKREAAPEATPQPGGWGEDRGERGENRGGWGENRGGWGGKPNAPTPSQASWGHPAGATPTWGGNYNQWGGHGEAAKGGRENHGW